MPMLKIVSNITIMMWECVCSVYKIMLCIRVNVFMLISIVLKFNIIKIMIVIVVKLQVGVWSVAMGLFLLVVRVSIINPFVKCMDLTDYVIRHIKDLILSIILVHNQSNNIDCSSYQHLLPHYYRLQAQQIQQKQGQLVNYWPQQPATTIKTALSPSSLQ